MSRRQIQRRALRVVTADEKAFKDTLAFFGAFMYLGVAVEHLVVGFYDRGDGKSSPMICIQKEAGYAYRFDDHVLVGLQLACNRRWQTWVTDLIGGDGSQAAAVTERVFREHYVSREEALEVLMRSLADARMIGDPDPSDTDYNLACRALAGGISLQWIPALAGERPPNQAVTLTRYERARLRLELKGKS